MAFKKEISHRIRGKNLNLTTIWKLKSVKGKSKIFITRMLMKILMVFCQFTMQMVRMWLDKFSGPSQRFSKLHNNECLGDLKFDCGASKKWGLGWRERLACMDSDFVSEYHKLYDEIYTHKQGRKAAK